MRRTRFARILPLTPAVCFSLLLPSQAEGAGCFYCFAGEINGIPFGNCSDNLPPGGEGYRFCQEPEFGEGDECNATVSSCAADMMTDQGRAAESDIASEFITGFR